MSDDLETTTEEVAETPDIEQEVADAVETPEDLGALKRALEHERAERRQAKEELRRIREDEEARTELLKEWGYEVATEDDSEEELFEDDEPQREFRDPRVDEILAREERQAIRSDLDAISAESEWELDDHDRSVIEAWARQDKKGFDRASLERAHQQYVDRLEGIATKAVERAKKPKPKAPHVTAAGKTATGTKPITEMTPEEHREWARERFAERERG